MKLDIAKTAYHRNGICGEGFHAITFRWKDEGNGQHRHMVAILFEEQGQCAVLDIDELTKDNIGFAQGNSWRGDHFEPDLRETLARPENEVAEANAHLIAAAPEMYVILADIAEALDKGTERLGVGREMILRQALAKAEG